MSKITIVGDLHITKKNIQIAQELFKMVEEMGNPVIWLGDLLDTKEIINGTCLNALIEYFDTSRLDHAIIPGNHDLLNLHTDESSLEALNLISNVSVAHVAMTWYGQTLIPYIHDVEKLKSVIEWAPTKTLFAHLDLKGFDFGNGIISQTGLSMEDLAKFDHVISGHYHRYQQKGNITYLGTPFSHSFGESNQEKVIGIFDTDSKVMEKALTGLPNHITQELTVDDKNEDFEVDLSNFVEYTEKHPENFYRLILHGTSENIERVNKLGLEKVKVIKRPIDLNSRSYDLNKGLMSDKFDPIKVYDLWASDIKGLSREVGQLGMDYLMRFK